jgi:hypothetical protein
VRRQLLEDIIEIGEDEPVPVRAPPIRDDPVREHDDIPVVLFAVDDDSTETVSLGPRHRSPPIVVALHILPRLVATKHHGCTHSIFLQSRRFRTRLRSPWRSTDDSE